MLHALCACQCNTPWVTRKSMKIICIYIFQNLWSYWGSTQSKDQSFKIITVLITFNSIDLFFKTRHVFKNKSIKFDKGSFEHRGITKYFSIWQTSLPSQAKFSVHSLMVQLHMGPLEITNFITVYTWLFWLGIELHYSQVSRLSCHGVIPIQI